MKQLILNFHGVGEPPAGTDPAEVKYWWDTRSFVAALDLIRSAIDEMQADVAITFDDGNASDARIALPALLERGLKASFFVCSGRIGQANYLDARAIADLLTSGMNVGSHGMHHVDWRRTSESDLELEIPTAIEILEEVCGRDVDEVAIPFGSYDGRVIRKLRQQNLGTVYTSDGGYVFPGIWLKGRNTLDRTWQGKDFLAGLLLGENALNRMRRRFAMAYKIWR